jgi:hypothetical protein
MSLHVFVGLALIPAVLLKLASTGWRFARYYARSRRYVAQGPPQVAMRLVGPLFVAAGSTSGVTTTIEQPLDRMKRANDENRAEDEEREPDECHHRHPA